MEKNPKADSLAQCPSTEDSTLVRSRGKFLLISQVGCGNTAGTKKRGWKTNIGFPPPLHMTCIKRYLTRFGDEQNRF